MHKQSRSPQKGTGEHQRWCFAPLIQIQNYPKLGKPYLTNDLIFFFKKVYVGKKNLKTFMLRINF